MNINAKIHEWLGYKSIWHPLNLDEQQGYCGTCGQPIPTHFKLAPDFERDGNSMLDLLTEVNKKGYEIVITKETAKYCVEFDTSVAFQVATAHADTLPLALALAVEKVIEGENK